MRRAAGFFLPDLPDFDDPRELDEGGEDVRVAMLTNLRDRHTSHTLHTRGEPAGSVDDDDVAPQIEPMSDLGTPRAAEPSPVSWPELMAAASLAAHHVHGGSNPAGDAMHAVT